MVSDTLERCSLHGWIPVFTVQGSWQTVCMASSGWAVCWCQCCGLSGPCWRWGYGMDRRMLWTYHHLMLQHDNARTHVARICTQFLEAENIPVLAWPAYSPDMSPIEHVWDALDRRIRQRARVPANIQQLHTAIEEEWTNNMWRRCVALHGTAHFRVVFYCGQPKTHLCNTHAV